jgi:hypothetical protein
MDSKKRMAVETEQKVQRLCPKQGWESLDSQAETLKTDPKE